MKNNKANIIRQYTGNFLVALMLVISFLSGPVTSEAASSKSSSSKHELSASSTTTDFEFTQIKSFKGNFVKVPTFSKIAEKLAEQTHIIFNEIYFIPYPQALTVNNFSRNVFYVFVSTKAP